MEKSKTIVVFTILTFLLFAVSTAFNPTFIPTIENLSESTTELVDQPDDHADSGKTQTLITNPIDSTSRIRLIRSNQFNRHNVIDGTTPMSLRFVRRHPCRKFRRSYGNDMISSDKTFSFDPKNLGDQVPVEWLEFKHKYGHGHGHHLHEHHDDDHDQMYEVDGEKFERHHHKKKEHEHKGGFMRSVRKFLKHTFDD